MYLKVVGVLSSKMTQSASQDVQMRSGYPADHQKLGRELRAGQPVVR
jgi:hypothetical protein